MVKNPYLYREKWDFVAFYSKDNKRVSWHTGTQDLRRDECLSRATVTAASANHASTACGHGEVSVRVRTRRPVLVFPSQLGSFIVPGGDSAF